MGSASKPQPTLDQIAQTLFTDAIANIIHDILLTEHRSHKLMINSLDPTTKLPHCERCNLPRLLDPPLAPKVRGASGDPPKDIQYCDKRPWARRPGHDIYDNPFLKADATGRPLTKKEREQARKNKDGGGDNTPDEGNSQANGTGPPSPSENGDVPGTGEKEKKLEKGEKKAIKIDEKLKKGEYVPWHTCPSCKRSLLITRFAKHLEQCMGLSGRAASRNAMAKMNGSTPSASRAGTPNPSQDAARGGDEDEDDDVTVKGPGGVRKKLLKKGLNSKLKNSREKGLVLGVNGKLPKGLAAKRPPGSGNPQRSSPAPSSATGDGKRDRDEMLLGDEGDDEDNVHIKKRQKISRVDSTASLNSISTGVAGGVAVEGGDSADGSFVMDEVEAGSVVDD